MKNENDSFKKIERIRVREKVHEHIKPIAGQWNMIFNKFEQEIKLNNKTKDKNCILM